MPNDNIINAHDGFFVVYLDDKKRWTLKNKVFADLKEATKYANMVNTSRMPRVLKTVPITPLKEIA